MPGPVDAIIAAMPEGSWKELPGTNMADACPPPYSHYPYEWTALAGTGDDPGAQAANSRYGRFRYSRARNVLVVVSGTKRNVYLWKPPATAP